MKLFHWYKVEALKDWQYGDVVVAAESLEDALQQLETQEKPRINTLAVEEIKENPEEGLKIYDAPNAVQIFGGA